MLGVSFVCTARVQDYWLSPTTGRWRWTFPKKAFRILWICPEGYQVFPSYSCCWRKVARHWSESYKNLYNSLLWLWMSWMKFQNFHWNCWKPCCFCRQKNALLQPRLSATSEAGLIEQLEVVPKRISLQCAFETLSGFQEVLASSKEIQRSFSEAMFVPIWGFQVFQVVP